MTDFIMIAKTQMGLEEVLYNELKELGARDIKVLNRAVSFIGDKGFMYKANFCLRTAIRVLKPIKSFNVNNEISLYNESKKIKWDNYISLNNTISVSAAINSKNFKHSHYVSLKVKDSIVDYFRDNYKGKRPDVNTKSPDIKINVHISNNTCNISLDSSGDSLHKRGYKNLINEAPINEVLAAGLILLSDWDKEQYFLDPMCGSGTILIEAAMIACKIPPSINRKTFSFMKWKDFDKSLWEKIKESSLNKIIDFPNKIIGCDRSFSAIRKTNENINNANLNEFIEIHRCNFFKKPFNNDQNIFLIFNPPYGERLTLQDLTEFYKKIGNTLKNNYAESTAWIITSDLNAVKSIGLKYSKKIKIFNGKLECYYLRYELYQGSKKHKKIN